MVSLTIHHTGAEAVDACQLAFATQNIYARYVPPGVAYEAEEPTIVVNLSSQTVKPSESPVLLRPWRSTIVRGLLRSPEPVVVLRIVDTTNLGRLTLDKRWTALGHTEPESSPFPRDTPLYVSPTEVIGQVQADRAHFTGEAATPVNWETFELHLKLWYAPPYTDCFIHTGHQFLEVHTQIHGAGRMQKFHEQAADTLYEDVPLVPGTTHECFAAVDGARWKYPWHRYFADTDCIWLAIELRPLATTGKEEH